MPNYPWLLTNKLSYKDIEDRMHALKVVGVPYSDTEAEYKVNVERFGKQVADMLDINEAESNLIKQAKQGKYDGNAEDITEMDALVAYLQMLGTLVDFKQFDDGYFATFR